MNNSEQNEKKLERMIREANKVSKEKHSILQKRGMRKLNIVNKKPKIKQADED